MVLTAAEIQKNYRTRNLERVRASVAKFYKTPHGRFKRYEYSARRRGYEFALEAADVNALLLLECHYCGVQNANGIDRKENDIGYCVGNVVSCCRTCNFMKGTLSYKDFKEKVALINQRINS